MDHLLSKEKQVERPKVKLTQTSVPWLFHERRLAEESAGRRRKRRPQPEGCGLFCFLVLPISEFIEINYGIIPGKKIGDRPRKHGDRPLAARGKSARNIAEQRRYFGNRAQQLQL